MRRFRAIRFSILGAKDFWKKTEQRSHWANIKKEGTRRMPLMDSTGELRLPLAAGAVAAEQPPEIECEVLQHFDEFRGPLLRYCLSLGIPVQDGEEVVQEVFLSLFRHLQLGRSRSNLRGWIFRVAHNLALKQRTANQRTRDRIETSETLAEDHRDPAPGPEEHLSMAQRRRRLLAVVEALPEADRSCLALRAEGLRYREIAAVLGISLGSVSASLTRALARLARADGR
jgi:RNA polymerase sigma-70 factor, ECF subfamily